MKPIAFVIAVAGLLAFAIACPPEEPPPPPPPEEDAGVPPAQAGEVCEGLDGVVVNACDDGLECGGAGADGFTCVVPAAAGDPCFLPTLAGPNPPDDGCRAGLVCSADGTCLIAGAVGAVCEGSGDCDSFICGRTNDGAANVCVVNECLGACPAGQECKNAGACGATCEPAAAQGEACFTPASADVCTPVRFACASGLECFVGSPETGVTCGRPGDDGHPCSLATPDDGCNDGFVCSGGQCQPITP